MPFYVWWNLIWSPGEVVIVQQSVPGSKWASCKWRPPPHLFVVPTGLVLSVEAIDLNELLSRLTKDAQLAESFMMWRKTANEPDIGVSDISEHWKLCSVMQKVWTFPRDVSHPAGSQVLYTKHTLPGAAVCQHIQKPPRFAYLALCVDG